MFELCSFVPVFNVGPLSVFLARGAALRRAPSYIRNRGRAALRFARAGGPEGHNTGSIIWGGGKH